MCSVTVPAGWRGRSAGRRLAGGGHVAEVAGHSSVAEPGERFRAAADARSARRVRAIRLLAKGREVAEVAPTTAFGVRWAGKLPARYDAGVRTRQATRGGATGRGRRSRSRRCSTGGGSGRRGRRRTAGRGPAARSRRGWRGSGGSPRVRPRAAGRRCGGPAGLGRCRGRGTLPRPRRERGGGFRKVGTGLSAAGDVRRGENVR